MLDNPGDQPRGKRRGLRGRYVKRKKANQRSWQVTCMSTRDGAPCSRDTLGFGRPEAGLASGPGGPHWLNYSFAHVGEGCGMNVFNTDRLNGSCVHARVCMRGF